MIRPRCVLLTMIAVGTATAPLSGQVVPQPVISTRAVPTISLSGLTFRDLNRSGTLDPFEDWRLTPAARAWDLVSRMTLEEKAGAMMHGTLRGVGPMAMAGVGEAYDPAANRDLIAKANVTGMITRLGGAPAQLAAQNNVVQAVAEETRLAIPLTISTDPRHNFQFVLGASVTAGQFSQWPETLGFAAIGDAPLMQRFGDIARQEYRAVGIHMALSPQADLATEPRWSRINGTFGEDPAMVGRMAAAYVRGFQHGRTGADRDGVLAIIKHWLGYGAAVNGWDGHNYYGRYARMAGSSLTQHAAPFVESFRAGVAGVMPTYSILQGAQWRGAPVEQVGAGFNRTLLTDMLRGAYGYRGLILTDWAVTNDCGVRCRDGSPAGERPSFADVAMPWGVDSLPMADRFVKAVRAGVDQFGGTERADLLVAAVRAGTLAESRLDTSAHRVMMQKFSLGLFENPFVDTVAAGRVTTPAFREAGLAAQRRSLVLLENRRAMLPLRGSKRVYLHGIDSTLARAYGWTVVTDPAQADVAIMRMVAPFETLHPQWMFGSMQHEGNLGFRDGDAEYETFKRVSAQVPTIVTVYLDRPAILTPLRSGAHAVLANFGISDAALLDVIAGRARPQGRLPFALPANMTDVEAQASDRPHDLQRSLYPFGFGLRYP
jgi:beta-glucosidase